MIQNLYYGVKIDGGGLPYITPILSDEELANVGLDTAFDTTTSLGRSYRWALGINMNADSSVNGQWDVYVSMFDTSQQWAIIQSIPITEGKFADGTAELFMYNFPNSANLRLVWTPSGGTNRGNAKIKFVINPNFV